MVRTLTDIPTPIRTMEAESPLALALALAAVGTEGAGAGFTTDLPGSRRGTTTDIPGDCHYDYAQSEGLIGAHQANDGTELQPGHGNRPVLA